VEGRSCRTRPRAGSVAAGPEAVGTPSSPRDASERWRARSSVAPGGGRDPRCPQEHPIATCTPRSTGAGQARRPRSPARRAAHVSGAPGQPARPPAPYRAPRPRRAAAASLRAALRSVSALRGLGPPSSSAAAAPSAGPPRAAAGARPGAPRASASSRLAAPSGAGAPAAGRGLGSAPQASGALPFRGRHDPRAAAAAAARCRAPSPARLGSPPPRWSAPAWPPPPALRLLCTRDARSGRRGAPPRPRARARARRAQGARARPPRAHRGLACCCPGKACARRGARLGATWRGRGEPSGRPGACTLAVLPSASVSWWGGKDSRAAAGKGIVRDYGSGFSPPTADPTILSLHPGGKGSLPLGRRSSARALCLLGG
jgi:hypothetical protein